MCNVTTVSEYLNCALGSFAMSHIPTEVEYYRAKRQKVKEALEAAFGSRLAGGIIYSGSVGKSTEINMKYDIDLIVPFTRSSFSTLREMLEGVLQYLRAQFRDSDLIRCELQKVSIGLEFRNVYGVSAKMDIVPGRETSEGQYKKDGGLNLYDSDNETPFLTNISAQIAAIQNCHGSARSIIRLLKGWKFAHKKNVKSILLELLVLKAMPAREQDVPSGLWNQMKLVLEYIRDHIEEVQLIDPGNSGNNVAGVLTPAQKTQLAYDAGAILKDVAWNINSIKTYFPDNIKYCAPR